MSFELFMFTFLMVVLTVAYNVGKTEGILEKRKAQTQALFNENVLKKRLEQIAEDKVKFSKRYKIETMCLQAGFKLSYAEYKIVSFATGVLTSIVVGTVMNNPYLAFMFFFIGFVAPGQIISFLKNRRVVRLEGQIGAFMKMVIKRYETTKDFSKALELTMVEFKGEEPIYTELKQTVLEINLGKPVGEAMDDLARRTGNKYMERLSDYYKIASSLGTEDVRKKLLNQAYDQFEENRQIKRLLNKEISGPKREAYVMLASIPMIIVYQCVTNNSYIDFMTNTFIGKIGTTFIAGIFIGCVWFVNAKIGAPLD